MKNYNRQSVGLSCLASVLIAMVMTPVGARADHLSRKQCYAYFECVLGSDSALNNCYDNSYLKKESLTRVMCMRMAQHNCKVETGIQGTGRQMRQTRPIDFFHRLTIMDLEAGDEMGQDQDIRIYNYGGWNHCPAQYQGLQDFWCDPHQLRYPPRPWCDVLPVYNVNVEDIPGIPKGIAKQLQEEIEADIKNRQ